MAAAVNLLARHEILPEDLMSAALDFLPPDPFKPLPQRLLAAQDYLEERQTLVDNIEAGDLFEIDLRAVDLRNVARAMGNSSIGGEGVVAAAFYLFAARKTSFDEVWQLVSRIEGSNVAVAVTVLALAGAYHGSQAIPSVWKTTLPDYNSIVERAQLSQRQDKQVDEATTP